MSNRTRWSADELVPLADRRRYMLMVRAALMAAIAITAGAAPGLIGTLPPHLAIVLAGWAGWSLVAELLSRLLRGRALFLLGTTLIVDGLALVWLSTVGSVTNVRYLIFFQMVAVVLLASYRTGFKMALWYALLLFTVYFGQHDGAFGLGKVNHGTVSKWDLGQIGVFVAVLWITATATAVFSSVNERELRRRRFDLEALARFAVALESATDRQAVASTLIDSLAENFPVGRLLLVSGGRRPVVLGQRGTALIRQRSTELGPDSAILLAESGHQTLLLSHFDDVADPWLSGTLRGRRNFMLVPLHAEGGCVGTLVIEHRSRGGSRVERRLVSIIERFAAQAALALRNASLLEEMERMASTDGLTSVANRRTFEANLRRELARAMRSSEPLSIVMLDIDDFKRLNDTFGHQVGDDVLRQVAATLAAGSREIDSVARYGGEEFAVILPGCGHRDALASAERLCHQIGTDASGVPVTVSVGVATFPEDARTGEALVRAADAALYEAKRAGRNRVRVASPAPDLVGAATGPDA